MLHYVIYFNCFPSESILIFYKNYRDEIPGIRFGLFSYGGCLLGVSVTWRTGGIASIKMDGHYVTQLWNT